MKASYTRYCSLYTAESINITDYSKLYIRYTVGDNNNTIYTSITFGVSSTIDNANDFTKSFTTSTGAGVAEIDISSLTGNYFVKIYDSVGANVTGRDVYIYEIYLTK